MYRVQLCNKFSCHKIIKYFRYSKNKFSSLKAFLRTMTTFTELNSKSSQLNMQNILTKTTQENAVKRGLKYLEQVLEASSESTFLYASNYFGPDRGNLKESHKFKYSKCNDKFFQYLLLELLGDKIPSSFRSKLVAKLCLAKIELINYFHENDALPDDAETNSVCYAALLRANVVGKNEIEEITESIIGNVNEEGIIHAYFVGKEDERYNRVDAATSCNILRFAYAVGQEHRVRKTEDFVYNWLASGNYKQGAIYYPSPRTFLYFCSVFAKSNNSTKGRFRPLLRQALDDNMDEEIKYPLDYAQEILARKNVGGHPCTDKLMNDLISMQNLDGSWPVDSLLMAPNSRFYFGSKFQSTMFALAALLANDEV